MKRRSVLLVPASLVVFTIIAVFGQDLPRQFPAQPVRIPYVDRESNAAPHRAEMRPFRFAGNDYWSALFQRDIEASPEWNPAQAPPVTLGGIEAIARTQLRKLVTDDARWETSSIQLNRLSQGAEDRWYYAVGFIPVVRATDLPHDDIVILLTIDGKPGTIAKGNRR